MRMRRWYEESKEDWRGWKVEQEVRPRARSHMDVFLIHLVSTFSSGQSLNIQDPPGQTAPTATRERIGDAIPRGRARANRREPNLLRLFAGALRRCAMGIYPLGRWICWMTELRLRAGASAARGLFVLDDTVGSCWYLTQDRRRAGSKRRGTGEQRMFEPSEPQNRVASVNLSRNCAGGFVRCQDADICQIRTIPFLGTLGYASPGLLALRRTGHFSDTPDL